MVEGFCLIVYSEESDWSIINYLFLEGNLKLFQKTNINQPDLKKQQKKKKTSLNPLKLVAQFTYLGINI